MVNNPGLHKQLEERKVLLAAHRGTCGGNIIQNTIGAYENALLHGADIIEVDVVRTTDGKFFAFHNGQEKGVFGKPLDIRTLSSDQVRELRFINGIQEQIGEGVNSLDDILEHFKGRCLINIDRTWFFWNDIIAYLKRHNMQDQIILKSHPEEGELKLLEELARDMMFLPIVRTPEQIELVNRYHINTIGAEVIFETDDHLFASDEFIGKMHGAGWVIPLDDYLDQGEMDAYLPGPLSAFQLNGKTWGLPFMADAGALYYRKDLLEKYGKPVPETWEELAATGKEIAEAEGDMSGFVSYWMQNESLTSSMLEFYWEKGGEVVDENGANVLDEAKLAETLAEMKAMIDHKVAASGIETFNTAASRAVVTAGGAVFTRDWLSGYAPFNAEDSAVAGNMEIAPLPSYGSLGGWGVMVSAFSGNQEEAVEFAKFRANYESQMIACDLVDIKPTLKAAYEDEELLSKKPELPGYLPVLEASKPRPLSPYYAEISGVMQLEIHSVITGLTTPEEGAANIIQKVGQILL